MQLTTPVIPAEPSHNAWDTVLLASRVSVAAHQGYLQHLDVAAAADVTAVHACSAQKGKQQCH
jgi:hypothetical protein